MKFKEIFEKVQVAITFAEAGLFDDAREVMNEKSPGGEKDARSTRSKWTTDDGNLRSAPARS